MCVKQTVRTLERPREDDSRKERWQPSPQFTSILEPSGAIRRMAGDESTEDVVNILTDADMVSILDQLGMCQIQSSYCFLSLSFMSVVPFTVSEFLVRSNFSHSFIRDETCSPVGSRITYSEYLFCMLIKSLLEDTVDCVAGFGAHEVCAKARPARSVFVSTITSQIC